jgi:hypothetical protein
VPSFGCPWGYNLSYNHCAFADVPNWHPEETSARIREGVREGEADKFSFYDGIGHRSVFALPKWARDACAKETRVMCKATPVFLT